jgi:hypothetical protein
MQDYFNLQPELPKLWYHNPNTKHLFGIDDIIVGSVLGGAASAGFGALLGGGGGSRMKAPPAPKLDPRGEEFQAELYPRITSGLQGAGITPEIDATTRRKLLATTGEEFLESSKGLESFMNRAIPRSDVKVRQYMKTALMSQYARQKESIGREFEFKGLEDKSLAQSLAFDALSGEKRMGAAITSQFNQSALRRGTAPDYQSELFGGLGSAAGIALAGPIGYANQFSSQR